MMGKALIMFEQSYFWYYIGTFFFTFMMQRCSMRGTGGSLTLPIYNILWTLCAIAILVFLIIGFWKMPHWSWPLKFFGLSILTAFIPIPDRIGALIGVVAPVFCVLMFVNLF